MSTKPMKPCCTEAYEAGKFDGNAEGMQHAVIGRQAVIDIQTEAKQETAREILQGIGALSMPGVAYSDERHEWHDKALNKAIALILSKYPNLDSEDPSKRETA